MHARRSRNNITVSKRVIQGLGSDQAACVRDVGHEERALFVRRLAEGRIVPITRVRRCTADDEPRLEQTCLRCEPLIVNELCRRVESIRKGLEVDRGGGYLFLCGLQGEGQIRMT